MTPTRDYQRHPFHNRPDIGTAPGTIAIDSTHRPSTVTAISFGPEELEVYEGATLEQIQTLREKPEAALWVHVSGLGNRDLILELGHEFSIHELALEDVVTGHQQVKVDRYPENLFIVFQMLTSRTEFKTQQLGIFLGTDYLITFEESPSQLLDLILPRLRNPESLVRKNGADFLAYVILDIVIDQFFPLLEEYGQQLDAIEDELTENPTQDLAHQINEIRMVLRSIRRVVWRMRETTSNLTKSSNEWMTPNTRVFLRDCHDHTIQLVEVLESYHETSSGLRDVHLTLINNQMNEVMMVLTVIATIFIPLGFITGIYGMNFNPKTSPWNMPEVNWYYGYPMVLGLMGIITFGLLMFFYRRGWIGPRR